MRCAAIKGFGKDLGHLVIEEREAPVARGDHIRVRVVATALNRADLLQRRGLYPAPAGTVPDIPGLEFVGHVDQVGETVTDWKGGERVFGVVAGGSYAEQLVTHQRLAVPVPDELSDVEAAAVPEAFLSAHDALVTQGGLKAGDRVLVHAVAGGVGSAAVQLVHVLGALGIGTAGSPEKLAKAAELAPFFGIDYRQENFQTRIEAAFGPNAVNLILDTVGGSHWQQNLAVLAPCGTLVLFGLLGGAAAETPLALVLFKRLRIVGTALRGRPLEEKIQATRDFAHQVVPHLRSRRLRPVIDSVFTFQDLHQATSRMEGDENTGKIVLTFP